VFFPAAVVPDHAVAAAEAGQDDVDVGVAENGVTRGLGDLAPGLGAAGVEVLQGLVFHLEDGLPLVLGGGALGGGAARDQSGCQEDDPSESNAMHALFPPMAA
jgi:hypothetical protein